MVTGMGGNHEKNRSAMDNEGFYTMKGYERANVDEPVSYTHLDVYKRQSWQSRLSME